MENSSLLLCMVDEPHIIKAPLLHPSHSVGSASNSTHMSLEGRLETYLSLSMIKD